tara:strand:- start:35 stop:259 length:225 start_codon:yes stop_codon:yes gene_type:complete
MAEKEKNVINIDGKDYDIDSLPLELRNTLAARQEIQQSRVRHEIELEKIDVLTAHYNNKIQEGIKQFNGSGSKS